MFSSGIGTEFPCVLKDGRGGEKSVFIGFVLFCQRDVMSKLGILLTYFEKVVDLIYS